MAGRFSLSAIFRALDQFSKPVAQMEDRFTRFTRRVTRGLGGVDRVNAKISDSLQASAVAAGAAGLAMGAGLMHVVHAGADFEQAITNVGAVMGKNRGQIQELEKEAMRLGVVTQFSSSQVAEAMEFMARKGFDSEEILAGIPGVLNAVAASGQGMAEVATVVGSSIRGFGLDAKDASRVADILAFTAEKTGATITDLGTALATAAPTAKTLGVSIEDALTSVGLMQKMGIDASTSGTAVATMLAKISKPSKDAAAQMANMGIKFKDARGNMLPFRDVLGQFVKAGDKAGGNMDRMAFFAELVGLRGDKAALALADMAHSGDFDKLANGIRNTGGYAEKVANIRLDTTQGSWKLLLSTVEVVETKLFNLRSGALRGVIDGMNKWLQVNQDIIVQDVSSFILKVSNNLPQIILWLKRIAFGVVAFYTFSAGVKLAIIASTAFEYALAIVSFTTGVLSTVLGVLAMVTDTATVAAALHTAWLWIKNAATVAYTAVVWLGVAAMTAYGIVTSEASVNNVLATGIMTVLRAGFIAYNAVVGFGTALIAAYNAGTLLSTIQQGALITVVWLAVAAQTALNAVMSINPMFLLGMAIIGLVALVLKLTGAWDWLKNKIVGFAATVMSKIQPIIDKVTAFIAVVKSAGAAVGNFLGIGGGGAETPAGAPGGVNLSSDNNPIPILTPNDAVATSVQQTMSTNKAELTIKDQTGRAEVTKQPNGPAFSLDLQSSGAF